MPCRRRVQLDLLIQERRITAEIDPDVTILLVSAIVEQRSVSRHANQPRLPRPTRLGNTITHCLVILRFSEGICGFHPNLGLPQTPPDLKLVSVVLMQQFQRILHGLPWLKPPLSVSEYLLKYRRLAPVHRPDCRRVHTRLTAMFRKNSQNRRQLVSHRRQPQIRVPQA